MEYSLSLKNQLLSLKPLFSFTIMLLIALCFVFICYGLSTAMIIIGAVYFFIDYFYTIVLHYQYYKVNKDSLFVVDNDNKLFKYRGRDSELMTIEFEEVKCIVVYMMPNVFNGSAFRVFPFEDYNYAVIYSDKEDLIITSLLVQDSYNLFSGLGLRTTKECRLFLTI